jgi:cell division protein FtsZ
VLGPTTQKQANKSRQAIEGVEDEAFDAASNFDNAEFGETDGGRRDAERNNGLDVVRTDD